MKQKIFLSLMMLMAVFSASAYDFEVDGFSYSIKGDEATLTGGYGLLPDWDLDNPPILYYTIVIPETVTYEGVTYPVTAIRERAYLMDYDLLSVTIGNSVTHIGRGAFEYCRKLTSVTIGNSVTEIGDGAFEFCYKLKSLTIPKSVTSIGFSAFNVCQESLESITVENGNPWYDSRDNCNAIIETVSNRLILGCQNTTIPPSVREIGSSAFYCCFGLTYIPFESPWGRPTIIGDGAFAGCKNLTRIDIPSSVGSIGTQAFYHCYSVTSVTCHAKIPPTCIASSSFNSFDDTTYSNATLYVPAGSLAAYREADGWKEFVDIRGIGDIDGDGVLNIRDLTSLIDLILNGSANVEDYPGADVNGDGVINITDVTRLIDQILSSSN